MPTPAVTQTATVDPAAPPSPGQPAAIPAGAPILTVDQDRLFRDSALGRASQARIEAETAALAAENRRIEAALEAEERDLTARRAQLPPEEFAVLAEAFDTKVEGIREAQDAKSRDITRRREEDSKRFLDAVIPVLGAILAETGAVAIVDRAALVVALNAIDVTDLAIARVDAALPPAEAPPGPDPAAP